MISVSLAKINKNPRFHKKYGDFFKLYYFISQFIMKGSPIGRLQQQQNR